MPEIAVISNGVSYTLLESTSHRNSWYLLDGTGSHVLGLIVHHLPLGWSGQTLRERRNATDHPALIRASRLDAIQDLIQRREVEADQRTRRQSELDSGHSGRKYN